MHRVMQSDYMYWAKTKQSATYNLAISGMISYPLSGIPVSLDDIDVNGPNAYGFKPLHEEIAKRYHVHTENIVTTFGTSMANYLAMAAIINPGDRILMEHPVYELIASTAGFLGARIDYFSRRPEEGFQIDPHAIARAIQPGTKLIVITNLHNPSSAYTDAGTIRRIAEIADRVGAKLLVDEVYLDAMFDDAPPTALTFGNNVIVTNSLTKIYGLSGIRCGWILAEPSFADKIWRIVDITYGTGAYPPEVIAAAALRNLPAIAARSRAILEPNHALLTAFLEQRSDIRVVPQKYGTVVFPEALHGHVDALADLLRTKYDTTIVPGRFFDMPRHFRLGICGETEMVREGLLRLGKALDEVGT